MDLVNLSEFGRVKYQAFVVSMFFGLREGMVHALSEMALEGSDADAAFADRLARMLEPSLATRVYRRTG